MWITRALDAGVPAAWVTGDAVYGQHYKLRKAGGLLCACRADELIVSLTGRAWRTLSAGQGAKGEHRYVWARARINGGNDPEAEHWLLARRPLADPQDAAYWICHGPKKYPWPSSSGWPAPGGRSRRPSRPPKAKAGSSDQYPLRQWTG